MANIYEFEKWQTEFCKSTIGFQKFLWNLSEQIVAKSEIEIQYVQMLILWYIFAIDYLIFI